MVAGCSHFAYSFFLFFTFTQNREIEESGNQKIEKSRNWEIETLRNWEIEDPRNQETKDVKTRKRKNVFGFNFLDFSISCFLHSRFLDIPISLFSDFLISRLRILYLSIFQLPNFPISLFLVFAISRLQSDRKKSENAKKIIWLHSATKNNKWCSMFIYIISRIKIFWYSYLNVEVITLKVKNIF